MSCLRGRFRTVLYLPFVQPGRRIDHNINSALDSHEGACITARQPRF
jgi:hypothetical protein